MSTAAQRAKRREELDRAYALQAKAAAWYTVLGISLATIGHSFYPPFRRQTLAFKGFLVSAFTMFGLVVGADTALLSHERNQRISETALRREARLDLARRGIVGTESEIAKWKEEREARLASEQSEPPPPNSESTSSQ
ncbi:hypothetical protein SCHPADRAFT_398981 [Schizopora paradoxa]|uniref:HIG1 domain-containing protein n=1 Tax=Schizopora paradoxa TaxID=27342 RepID=A0A0H2RLS3_9AGAM|nr:hypothetical protein SCHPADRAFT_398981 [Schizopora paradoxa]